MKRIEVESRASFIGLAGSHGYGLSRPESDYDYQGVFIAPKEYYLGFNNIEQKDSGWDSEPGMFPFLDGNKDTVIIVVCQELIDGCRASAMLRLYRVVDVYITDITVKIKLTDD